MRRRRGKREPFDGGFGFFWHEIPCPNESAARAEAARQNELEDPAEVEWIYLRTGDRQWVARRTPRELEAEPEGFVSALLGGLLRNFSWH